MKSAATKQRVRQYWAEDKKYQANKASINSVSKGISVVGKLSKRKP